MHQQLEVLLSTLCLCHGAWLIIAVGLFLNNTPKLSRYSRCTLQVCEQMRDQTLCLETEMISRHVNLPALKLSELQSQDGNPPLTPWLLIQLLG